MTRMRNLLVAAAAALAAAAGCVGSIATDERGGASGGTATGRGGATGGIGGPVAVGGSSGGGTAPAAGSGPVGSLCRPGESAPVPRARLWRLSPRQYVNTIKQLTGADVPLSSLPLDGVSEDAITRFDTNADNNLVNDRLAAVYRDQAQAIAEATVNKLAGTPQACVLEAAATDACIQGFVKPFATRAYRRPLAAGELDRMVAFVKTSRQKLDARWAARMMIEAILQSPHFLYRSELGATPGPRAPLTPHELASELAYFLADSPPDDALLAAADRNELGGDAARLANVRAHAERLIATPAARAKLKDFFSHELLLEELEDKTKDAKLFPTFTEALKKALVTETTTFIEKALYDNQGTFETLFAADYSYQNAMVAKHYGLALGGNEFQRVTLPRGRAGVMSHAGVMAALSSADNTSPVHRGTFFYQTLLCRPLPQPPPDAQDQASKLKDPDNPMSTQREMFTYMQRVAPSCAACHSLFQPMGLSLEIFDPIGRYREQELGKVIDPSVTVTGLGADLDGAYANGVELSRKIATSQSGRECLALQYMTFAFGRSVDPDAERCRLAALADRFRQRNLNVQALLVDMTQDDHFYVRSYP